MRGDDRVNAAALRDLTDDSGGRTEIVRDARDLNPATTSIADELSRQYFMGYPANGKKDGRWRAGFVAAAIHDLGAKSCATRSFALRARGFREISPALGAMAFLASSRY